MPKNHKIVSQKEWLAARLELLKAEKELTRQSDELARKRQELPWVRIDKEYRFDTDEGQFTLADRRAGRTPRQPMEYAARATGSPLVRAMMAAAEK